VVYSNSSRLFKFPLLDWRALRSDCPWYTVSNSDSRWWPSCGIGSSPAGMSLVAWPNCRLKVNDCTNYRLRSNAHSQTWSDMCRHAGFSLIIVNIIFVLVIVITMLTTIMRPIKKDSVSPFHSSHHLQVVYPWSIFLITRKKNYKHFENSRSDSVALSCPWIWEHLHLT